MLCLSLITADVSAIEYPQRIEFENGHVMVHAPQISEWQEFSSLSGHAALEGYRAGNEEAVFASAEFAARTVPDVDRRVVTFSDLVIKEITFADGERADERQLEMFQQAMPVAAREVPLDLVLSNLPEDLLAPDTEGIKSDPPEIRVAFEPTLLVLMQGEAVAAPIKDNDMFFVVNTNWTLFTDKKKKNYYLLNGTEWLHAKKLVGPWKYPRKLPKPLRNLPLERTWQSARAAAKMWQAPKGRSPAKVVVSTTPAELIVIAGKPLLAPVVGEALQYVSNTDSHVFLHDDIWYYVVSGRWFSASGLEDEWLSVTDLPQVFRELPQDHAKADVRAVVPGTMESRMAAFEALMPRRTEVALDSKPDITVAYAGEPNFEQIPGTDVARALNTGYDVVRVGEAYYLCWGGVWYQSDAATGPWQVATVVPVEVYEIPPSSPAYHTTHVRVEESSNVHVSFAFTAGYYGSYVHYGVPVWGTGYYYSPYVYYDPFYTGYPYYPIYYPYPYTYGGATFYNPRTGTYGSTSRYYGPFGGYGYTSAYNPRTGTYLTAESMWDGDEWAGAGRAHNPRTGRSFETERYYDADDDKWKVASTLEGRRGSVDVNRRFDDDSGRATLEGSRGGSGEIRRNKSDGGWNTRSEFETADGRTVTGSGRYEDGEGSSTLRGSEGGTGTIEREITDQGVRREGSFERDGKTLQTETIRAGQGPRTTFETSGGASGVVSGRALNKTAAVQGSSGDLYAGRDGNVYKKANDGWYKRSDGDWQQMNRPSTNRSITNTRTQSLNRDYRARSHGMNQYRNRSGQFQSRMGSAGRMRRR